MAQDNMELYLSETFISNIDKVTNLNIQLTSAPILKQLNLGHQKSYFKVQFIKLTLNSLRSAL